jgi:asparagine synthetase B (glutamine-hydrolysing)
VRRYWNLAAQPELRVGHDEARERFDQALARAVSRCTAEGPAGIFLSGGLDSISIAAVASDLARREGRPVPLALSLGFPDPECDEEFVQRGAADALGLPQDFVRFEEAVGARGLLARAGDMSATLPAPLLNFWNPAYAALAGRARDRGRSIVLTGTGGDEWLSVTPLLGADLLKSGRLIALTRLVRMALRSYPLTTAATLYMGLWNYSARPVLGMLADRIAPAAFRARRKRKIVDSTPAWIAPDPELRARMDARAEKVLAPSQPANGSFYEQEMRTALDHPLVSMEYEESFEFGRRFDLTFMHPFCDADLVELLYRLPPEVLIEDGRAKSLVRQTVAKRFPALGFERQRKVNATRFYHGILQREGPAAWEHVGRGRELVELGIVDAGRLEEALGRLFTGGTPQESFRVWTVVALAAWTRSRHHRSGADVTVQ